MATNEQNRPPESIPTGGTSAGGGAASAFERPVPPRAEPEISPASVAPEVLPYRPGRPRNRLVSLSRSAGHYTGTVVAMFHRTRRQARRQGIREQAEHMVREHPSVLAGAAVLGFVVGRVLRGR